MKLDLARLTSETFVRFVDEHAQLPSTNDLAMRLAVDGRTETPRLIIAHAQTAGRGRGANRWWSGPGAVTMTLIIEPADFSIPSPLWPCVALTTGLSVCEALDPLFGPQALGLKWPNDVWLNSKKVCGILVEIPHCRPPVPARLVIGLGINLNNSIAESVDAPADVRERATTVRDEAGRSVDPTEFLLGLFGILQRNLLQLAEPRDDADTDNIRNRWQSRCVLRGRQVEVLAGEMLTVGFCHGIDAEGALDLETLQGHHRCFGGTIHSYSR